MTLEDKTFKKNYRNADKTSHVSALRPTQTVMIFGLYGGFPHCVKSVSLYQLLRIWSSPPTFYENPPVPYVSST